MNIITSVLNKMLFLAFFLSLLFVLREVYILAKALADPAPKPYKVSEKKLFWIGLALACVLTCIFNRITL